MLRPARHWKAFYQEIAYSILFAHLVACTTVHSSSTPHQQINKASQVSLGQLVEVTEHDGTVSRFRVEKVTDNGISGGEYSISYNDIEQIAIVQPDSSTYEKVAKEIELWGLGMILAGVFLALFW